MANESQCTSFCGVREVAGTVNSKSCATTVPLRVGDEKLPPATPLNVASPSTRKGRSVGPPRAAIRGRHSSRFEVETETRTVEDDASVPDASILESGVVRLNLDNSRESFAALYSVSYTHLTLPTILLV